MSDIIKAKTLRAIVGGLSIVMAIYIVINLAYLWVAPASELKDATAPAALVANKIFDIVQNKNYKTGSITRLDGEINE